MSSEELEPTGTQVPRKYNSTEAREEIRKAIREDALDKFSGLVGTALQTIQELCVMSDSDSVRLEAAKTVLKMAKVDPTTQKQEGLSADDRKAIQDEMAATMAKLAENNPHAVKALTEGPQEAEVIDDHNDGS